MASVTKEYNLKVNTKDSQKNVENLNEGLEKTSMDLGGVENAADRASGGMVSGFKGVISTMKGVIVGFKTMRGAIIATGLGALVIAVTSLAAAFTGSEAGQNKFAKIMGVIGALTGNIVDLMADLGEAIISVFENPVESLKSFGKLIKDNLVTRFEGLINLIPNLGRAVEQLFKGNFSEAGKIAADSVGQVVLGVESITDTVVNATNAVKEFTAEQIKEGKAAAKVADMRAEADKIERGLIVDRSKLESEIAQLRLKSRQEEEFSAAERKQALLDAQVLEDELLDKETTYLELRRDAQLLENTFSRTNKENLTLEAEAIAAVNRQQAARANTARQVQREVNTITKQIQAEDKAIAAEAAAKEKEADAEKLAAAKTLADLKNQIRDAAAVSEDEKRALEIEKTIEHYDNLIELAKANGLVFEHLEKAKTDKINAIKTKGAEETAKTEVKWSDMTQKEKSKIAVDGLNNLASVLGTETAAGKAAAIGAATISTFQSATDSFKSLSGIPIVGPALGAIAAAAAVVSGIANVKKITQTKTPTVAGIKGGPTVSAGAIPTPAPPPAPPSLDSVSSSGFNQLADAIGEQTSEPVQAYVVSNDVTTAQSLERNIVDGASIS